LEKGKQQMHKVVSSVIIALLLSSILEIGFIIHPVNASGGQRNLMTTLEDVSISENGTIHVSILMNASSGLLAEMYRKMLAAPTTVNIEEEVPIPENATEKVDAGGNVTDVSIPVREGFYESIVKEQLLSLGLRTTIIDSGIVPKGSENECRVMMCAVGSFEIFNVTSTDSNETWEVGVGPLDTSGITGLVLTRLMFTQMMLGSVPGEQVYQNRWHTAIRLPTGAVILNQDSLSGLNWAIDFGGGTLLNASASLDEAAAVLVDEDIVVTKGNVTATPEYLSNALSNYKTFKIRYSLPRNDTMPTESKQGPVNTNWSFDLKTDWVQFPNMTLPFRYVDSKGDLNMMLTLSPKFKVEEYVGWQFLYDWNFPFVHLDKFWAQMNFSTSIEITFEANASITLYENSWNIYYWKMTYPFYYGVPGWIDLVFTIDANLVIQGNMSFVAQAVINGELDTGVKWDHTNGWSKIDARSASANVTSSAWQLAIGISVTPSISFRIEFLFYSVAGPFVEFKPYLTLEEKTVLPDGTIFWGISVDFRIDVGVKFAGWLKAILGLGEWNWTLLDLNLGYCNGSWNIEPQPPPRELTHDLGISSLTVSPPIIINNNNALVNVTVRNSGDYNETSDITLSQNDSVIESRTHIDFTQGESVTMSFNWNTTTLTPDSYIVRARVNPVEGETNKGDNEMNVTVQVVASNDIAIVDVKADPNETYVGHTVNIAVTVENLGELTEDSNVTVSANDTTIETRSINQLTPDQSVTMTFIWSTGGLDPGQYVVWANVSTLDYDINMANNNLTDEENIVRLRIPLHDIAVTDVVPYRNWVYEGRVVPVNVTLLNCGDLNETVTVDLYYNLTASEQVGTIVTDLSPNETKTLTFEWNTIGVQHCHNYTITALGNIQFDSNTTNNVNEGTIRIKVRIMGDLNGDGNVRVDDVLLVASAFGSQPGHPRWNPDADVNGDGKVRVDDVLLVARNFGKC